MLYGRQYLIELGSALALYLVLLFGANYLQQALHPAPLTRIILALTPMVGAVTAAWVIMRAIWRMDELQRRIQLDAIAMSFLGTALLTFGWGFAESAGLPKLRAFAVWPIMGTLWWIGGLVAQRRYR
ncbi:MULTISPECIES: hypothetical protein [unclassified Gluconobacter]|uniref:hypothetical protein n=1 Tax=unclassified Gluconobacter TaxID=2644261 RepID=UPI001762F411|nr:MULTISPECIES: hypothetical protein [unclassified Gluconobacter]GFE97556.1 hypothetical protein DmGdi_26290 [Gluconobacter sp. Gdi]